MIGEDAANRAATGAFCATDGGWSFAGALTLDNAAGVLEASRSIALPADGSIDFSAMTQADSAALAVMMSLKRRAASEGCTVRIAGLPATLRSLANVYGVEDLVG
jgi:phospholipid transport system transporter-binding protein